MVPDAALAVARRTTAELWEERLRALPDDPAPRRARGGGARRRHPRRRASRIELGALGIDAERAIVAMKRAQILLASGDDRLRWPHALLQEHLLDAALPRSRTRPQSSAPPPTRSRYHPDGGTPAHRAPPRAEPPPRGRRRPRPRELLHGSSPSSLWGATRDAAATLRDLALLDGRLAGAQPRRARCAGAPRRCATPAGSRTRGARPKRRAALFQEAGDRENEAHCLRLLGHIASDLAAPAQGRRLVARALALFEELGDEHGRAQCEVMLGEIDYLLGDHARARASSPRASRALPQRRATGSAARSA